tara:strand:+ start:70 stop:525 length:456 start_codon:yes stop_codon:yes gene_type:complete
LNYTIKKLRPKHISVSYLETINDINSKKFIQFSKDGKENKKKQDLIKYIENLPKNEFIFGVFKNKRHVANFKITKKEKELYIGFLVFLKFQGKGIIQKIFSKILNLKIIKSNNYHKLNLGVDTKNKRAIKLYKKLGFKYRRNSQKIMYINF